MSDIDRFRMDTERIMRRLALSCVRAVEAFNSLSPSARDASRNFASAMPPGPVPDTATLTLDTTTGQVDTVTQKSMPRPLT